MATVKVDTSKPKNLKHYELYHGEVQLDFNPDSPKYRYIVTDRRYSDVTNASIRGVTSVLKDIIAKPDLMTWPMNMANQFYFGAKFDEVTKEYIHDWTKAAIFPSRDEDGEVTDPLMEDDLHNIMLEGSKQWVQRADTGKDIGTLVHALVEQYLKAESGIEAEPVSAADVSAQDLKMADKALKAFTDWWESLRQKKVLSLEQVVYSRNMKYCGTFDLLAQINGRNYMLDLKTTNTSRKAPMGIYSEYFLQLGAYSYAIREETGEEVDDVGIIRVGKDGKLNIATAEDFGSSRDECERAFAFAIRLHDFLQKVTPFVTDAHFKSHLQPSSSQVEATDSIS